MIKLVSVAFCADDRTCLPIVLVLEKNRESARNTYKPNYWCSQDIFDLDKSISEVAYDLV